MARWLPMVQDAAQVEVYEDKSEQFRRWAKWMPPTWRFTALGEAVDFLKEAPFPLVSKADVGASSVNVRILQNSDEAEKHLRELWGPGITVSHGAGGNAPDSVQKGYALLQKFIPHKITWRVNAIGDARAIFMRYCYPDKAVAQTGNVEPAMKLNDQTRSLLDYANRVFADIGSKWCALDILQDRDGSWKTLETSLAWPWPSPGTCNDAPIFGSSRRWIQIWEVMFEQIEAGAFSDRSPVGHLSST